MTIRRDYNRPFFSKRKRNTTRLLIIGFLFGLIVGLVALVSLRFDQLQLEALDMVGMAPTPTPGASVLAAIGMEAYARGDIEDALAVFETAIQQRPNDIDYLYEYGVLLLENDDTLTAFEVGEHAIQVAPADPRGYVIQARALMYDDPAEAIQITIRGQEADELYAPLLAIQGVAYTNLGRYQEGIRQSLRAVELAPNDPFVLRATFTPLVYVARYQEAAHYLEQAISINPNLTAPYFELASLFRIQRPEIFQPEMSVALYNRILELDPDNARAYLRLCQTYANVPEADFSLAQPFCEQAIAIDPDFGDAYMTLGRMQYLRRNYEGSIESFEECVARGSEEIECWYLRGLAHFLLGQCEIAWELLTEAQRRVEDLAYVPQGTIDDIDIGLFNIKELCPGFSDVQLPTPIPPTPIPPTPIGGFG